MNSPTTVTDAYLMGIREGREAFRKHGMSMAQEELANLKVMCRAFTASSECGQMLRGERDFWANQIKKHA